MEVKKLLLDVNSKNLNKTDDDSNNNSNIDLTNVDFKVLFLPTQLSDLQKELEKIIIKMFYNDIVHCENKLKKLSIFNLTNQQNDKNSFINLNSNLNTLFKIILKIENNPFFIVNDNDFLKYISLKRNSNLLGLSSKVHLLNKFTNYIFDTDFQTKKLYLFINSNSNEDLILVEKLFASQNILYETNTSFNSKKNEFINPKSHKLKIYLIKNIFQCFEILSNNDFDSQNEISYIYLFFFEITIDFEIFKSKNFNSNLKFLFLIPIPIFSLQHVFLFTENYRIPCSDNNDFDINKIIFCLKSLIVNQKKDNNSVNFYYDLYGTNFSNMNNLFKNFDQKKIIPNFINYFNKELVLNFDENEFTDSLTKYFDVCDNFKTNDYNLNFLNSCNFFESDLLNNIRKKKEFFKVQKKKIQKKLNDFKKFNDENEVKLNEKEKILFSNNIESKEIKLKIKRKEKILTKLIKDCNKNEQDLIEIKKLYNTLTNGNSLKTNNEDTLLELKKKSDELKNQFEELENECDNLRNNNREQLQNAFFLRSNLNEIQSNVSILSNKLYGLGTDVLPSLIKKDILKNYEDQIIKEKSLNKFSNEFFSKNFLNEDSYEKINSNSEKNISINLNTKKRFPRNNNT